VVTYFFLYIKETSFQTHPLTTLLLVNNLFVN